MDYKNGKIYRIVCEETGRQYIGSTTSTLVKRLSQHKNKAKRPCCCKDFINPKIFLLEDYPCERKEQLLMRERYWIENMDCVNIVKRPIVSRDEMLKRKKEYYENNKEERLKYQNQYKQNNKEKILERDRNYYHTNKEKISKRNKEKFTCECGSIINKGELSRHKKSKKHQSFIT